MAKTIKEFYGSSEWQKCREAYKKKVGGLCEECLKEGIITPCEEVHHIVKLDRNSINDPSIALAFSNLQCLCKKHHEEKHKRFANRRYDIDENGVVHPKENAL